MSGRAGAAPWRDTRRPDQPGAESTPPSGEVAKTSAVMDLLRKLSADGASLTGGEVKGKAPAARKDLEDNLVIPGAVASSKGTSAQKVPADAVVGHTSDNPAGTPGRTAATPNEVAKNAAIVAMISTLPWQAFGPGTEGGKAQPEIWSNNAKFKAASEKMQLAVVDLNKAAQSGDLESIKKAFGTAGASCKNCHDDFKKK